jgi:hypothetical protein
MGVETMNKSIAIIAALLVASVSGASTLAPSNSNARGKTFEMCSAQSASGVCDTLKDGTGITYYAEVMKYGQFTVYYSQDTGAGSTCDVYGSDQDTLLNMPVALATTDGTKLNATPLSSTNTAWSFEAPFSFIFVECTVSSGTHSVLLQAAAIY